MRSSGDFIRKFEDLSLPADEFNHRGHLWLAWLYIKSYSLGEASKKLNAGIQKYAESLGAKDKYHCTLTTTFACAIKSRFKQNEAFEEFLANNKDLSEDPISIIQVHYSPELLQTAEAKKELVPPDRKAFPQEYTEQLVLKH